MSINGSRRTSNKERGRLRQSLKTEGISGWTGTIITDPGRDFAGHSGFTTTQVVSTVFQVPVNQILEKKSRMSHTFNGRIG